MKHFINNAIEWTRKKPTHPALKKNWENLSRDKQRELFLKYQYELNKFKNR